MVGLDLVESGAFGQIEFGLEGSGLVVALGFQILHVGLGEVEGGFFYHYLGFGSKGWFDLSQ